MIQRHPDGQPKALHAAGKGVQELEHAIAMLRTQLEEQKKHVEQHSAIASASEESMRKVRAASPGLADPHPPTRTPVPDIRPPTFARPRRVPPARALGHSGTAEISLSRSQQLSYTRPHSCSGSGSGSRS